MIVLGLDPGTRRCGFAVIKVASTLSAEVQEAGTWRLPEKDPLGHRLELLHQKSSELILRHNPHLIGLEKAVAFKNMASVMTLSEARGILRLAIFENLQNAEHRLVELSPTQVKRSGSGSGGANKAAMEKLMTWRFGRLKVSIGDSKNNSDAYDALAIAWAAWIVHNGDLRRIIHERQTRT